MNVTRITLKEALWRWQRGIAHALLLAGALAGMTLGSVAYAQIAFRNAASSTAIPPSFRAAASATSSTITFVGAGSQTDGSGTNITPAIPSGTQANDFAVLIVAGRPPDTTQPSAPAGWTLRSSVLRDVGSWDLKIMTFYRVLTGGDSNPTITLPSSWRDSSNGGMSGQIAVWRGVNTGTPFDVADATGTTSSNEFWTPPSITTATDGAWVVSAVATSDNNELEVDNANGFTGRMTGTSYDTTTGGDHAIGLADKIQATAGATTMLRWRERNNEDDPWVGITFALRPDPSRLIIDLPAGTVAGDVLVASIGFRPYCCDTPAANYNITPLDAGWTLLRRTDAIGASNSLAVYWKVAGASEPAAYRWSFSVSGGATFQAAAGGILSFTGVEAVAPVAGVEENGQATSFGTAHATPSITAPAASTMLVASYGISNAGPDHWTMADTSLSWTEAFDVGRPDEAVAVYWAVKPAAGATGNIQANSAAGDIANAHILALRPLGLTIAKPTGTVSGDFMVAAVGIRPDTASITPPSGWTLVRRTDQASGTSNALAVYTRVAGASEPASYTWNVSNSTHAVGGIQSFSGVDTSAAVNVEDGQATADSTSHATPSITPTVANTMLVTAHTFASSATWTPPSGMTEAYDRASLAVPNSTGQSIAGSYAPHVFLATGVKTATASGDSDTGATHILALRPLPVTGVAGGFNAYDTSTTPATAASGFIKTKIAGSSVSVSIAALNWPRTAVETGFTGTVRVEVLDASNNTGTFDVYGCRSSWAVLQTLSDPTFVAGDNGRKTVSFTHANSYQDLRIRVSYPTSSPTKIGCSNDNFALRPNTFASFSVSDSDWVNAGTGRTLDNTTVPGGTVHKAGRPFTVQATAVNGAGTPATTTNYNGSPTPTLTDCGASSACPTTPGTLTLTTSFSSGVLSATGASYDEVGSFNLELRDTTFANVDAGDGTPADCSASGRYVCSSTLGVGRFVPDNLAVALNTPSFGTTCGSFTYVGQKFSYSTAPVITVTARNSAGGTTTNYAGGLWQITNASLTPGAQAARYSRFDALGGGITPALDVSGLPGTDPVIFSAGAGTGTLTFGSGVGLSFARTTPVAPFDADIGLTINVIDADGVTSASNPVTFGAATAGNGIAFSSGKPMRFGRLTLRNANGSQLLPLPVPVEAQYWSGAPINGFITNTLDSCTVIASANDAMGNYTGNLSGSPTCETAITSGGTLSGGRGVLVLAAPGSGNGGSVDLTVNLGAAASGSTCTTQGGAPGSATTANLPHLRGNWSGGAYDQNPTARATFGISRGSEEVVFIRENF